MSRRRLEAAIQAGKVINQGDELTEIRERAEVYHCHRFEAVRDGVYCLQFSYDGKALVVGYGDGGVEALSTENGKLLRELQRHRLGGMASTCLRFYPQDHQVVYVASCEGRVTSCNISTGAAIDIVTEPTNEIQCMDFSLGGDQFATAGRDLNVRIYDSHTNKCVRTFPGYNYNSPEQQQQMGHAKRIFALKYHPQNDCVYITGGWDNHLKIWDSRTKDGILRTIHGPHICGDALDIKNGEILTGSWVAQNGLQLWDYGSGQLLETFDLRDVVDDLPSSGGDHPQGEFLYCAQFGGDDLIFAGGSGIQSALVINAHSGRVVSQIDYGQTVQAIDNTYSGHTLAVGGSGCKLKMVHML